MEQSVKYIYISEISVVKILNLELELTDDLEINLLKNFSERLEQFFAIRKIYIYFWIMEILKFKLELADDLEINLLRNF